MENNLKNICMYAFLAVHLKLTQYCYYKSILLQFEKSNIPFLMTLQQSINKYCLDLALPVSLSAVLLPVVQLLSHLQLFATSWTAACQPSLSFTVSWSFLKLMSIELVMLSNYRILCCLLLLLPLNFPSIRVFSSELTLRIRKYTVV